MERVIVIGAGVGGLAAAVRLQNAGYQVALYEKEPQVGGKMANLGEVSANVGLAVPDGFAVTVNA